MTRRFASIQILTTLIFTTFILSACADSNDEGAAQPAQTWADKPRFCTQEGIDVVELYMTKVISCYKTGELLCMSTALMSEEDINNFEQECITDGNMVYDSCIAAAPDKTIIGGCNESDDPTRDYFRIFYAPSQESLEAENCMFDGYTWYSCSDEG